MVQENSIEQLRLENDSGSEEWEDKYPAVVKELAPNLSEIYHLELTVSTGGLIF